MSISLDDYRESFETAAPEVRDTLESTFHEAARVMSPVGLADYLEGARGLANLGRGNDLVLSFLEEMPRVVQECGEDIIRDCINAAMKLSSMTSGQVIALLFSSLPTAAARLGDPELVRGYLTLVHQLSAKASRGLRPMLNNTDELLSKLTLSGLKRWANFGSEAYRRDLNKLVKYFNLESADSLKMLQKERRGTLFVDAQRRLNFYLRALWGRDFFLRPTASDYVGFKPYVEAYVMHLPDAVDKIAETSGLDLYRAQVAHLAAHMVYTKVALSADDLNPAEMFFIGLIEDARVEYMATEAFPGLKKLWNGLLGMSYESAVEHPTVEAIETFAYMLSDPGEQCDDAELNALAKRFHSQVPERHKDNQFSVEIGLALFKVFADRQDVPSLRILNSIRIPYRDDNRFSWASDEVNWLQKNDSYMAERLCQVRKYVSAMEMAHEVDCELAGDDAQEVWVCASKFMPYEDAGEAEISFNEMWGKEPISDPIHYQEWDYQVQLYRPDWATVYERRALKGDAEEVDRILTDHKPIAYRIKQIVDLLSPAGVQRERNLPDGDELDINAAVDAMIDIRSGRQPSPNITMRNVINRRNLAVTVLLDLSESTNDEIEGSEKTILELTREAAALVATAINGIGDPFALHGFASDGRHDVQYYRFKDFGQKFDDEAKARLDAMRGGLSTRMGPAMRHAGQHLLKQPERRKLLLLVTDGEPADIDERDPQYLRHDAKKAVEENYSNGVLTYCLTLDANADSYVKRIFGANNYSIVDNVERLPERLPSLFASLTS